MAQEEAIASTSAVLEASGPFDGGSLLGFLGRRAVEGIERVDGPVYRRTLMLAGGPATLEVEIGDTGGVARFWLSDPADHDVALTRVRWLLDLDVDIAAVQRHLADDAYLAQSIVAHPGLRVPGHVDGFEVAVRAIVGQQISVVGARTIVGRIVAEHGAHYAGAQGLTRLFPAPEVMAQIDPESLPMPRSRGRAIIAVARAVATGAVRLDRTVDRHDVRHSLLALPGIGPWTADYIALRALGDSDVFLSTDLGVRQGLARLGVARDDLQTVDGWRPWRSYALTHVWKALEETTA